MAMLIVFAATFGLQTEPAFENRRLALIPEGLQSAEPVGGFLIAFSADGRRAVYRAKQGDHEVIVVGESVGRGYEATTGLGLSADGTVVVYTGLAGGRWRVVNNEREGDAFEKVTAPAFAADGKTVVYAGLSQGKWWTVAGESKREAEGAVEWLGLGSDGKTVKYVAKIDGRSVLYADAKKIAEAEDLRVAVPCGNTPNDAYGEKVDGRWRVVVDGKPEGSYSHLGFLTWSADGKQLLYTAVEQHGWSLYIDGKERMRLAGFPLGFPKFSPDGRTLACVSLDWGTTSGQLLFVGDKTVGRFDAVGTPVFSPDGSRLAVPVCEMGEWTMLIGTAKTEKYDWVSTAVFSADGKKVAYGALKGREILWKVLPVDVEIKGETFEERKLATIPGYVDAPRSVTFAPDGRTVAYTRPATYSREKSCVALGDIVGEEFGGILDAPVFNKDGSRLLYGAGKIDREYLVVADRSGYRKIPVDGSLLGSPCFAPEGDRIAYAVKKSRKCCVVVGDQKGKEYADVAPWISFNADGRVAAYAAYDGVHWFAVVGDREDAKYNSVRGVTVSADGKHVAYAAKRGEKEFAVVDGKQGPKYDSLGTPLVLNSDGTTVAYVAVEGKDVRVVVGDKEGESFDAVGLPVFSPDGRTVAYAANDGGRDDGFGAIRGGDWFVVIGGAKGDPYEKVGSLVFSPDGKTMAFVATEEGKQFVVAGKKKSPKFSQAWPPVFSADGTKVGFGALVGKELWWKVLNVK